MGTKRWSRRRVAGLLIMIAVMVIGAFTAINALATNQAQHQAAEQLLSQAAPASPSASASPSATQSPSPAAAATASSPAAVHTTAPAPPPAIAYPITGFAWPAASMNVKVVTMAERLWVAQATSGVDPPLDKNGFDPVGHWLEGTGAGLNGPTPVTILAAHTCYSDDASLCNDGTFPFRQLSYGGWKVGQSATITDAHGQSIPLTLEKFQVIEKTDQLPIVQDGPGVNAGCYVQVFSCNLSDPHGKITLVTFKRSQCV